MALDEFPKQQIAGEFVDQDDAHVRITDSSKIPIDTTNPFPVSLPGTQFTGELSALNDVIDISTLGRSGTGVFEVTGTWTGKIVVEGAVNGTYNNLSVVQPGGEIAFTGINNDNMNGVYRVLIISAYTHLRLRMSAYTSGTASVTISTAQNVPTPFVWQLVPQNLNSLIYGKTGTATYQSPRIDPYTHSLQTVEYPHYEVHDGNHFTIANYDTNVAVDETLEFVIVTPNTTKWAHVTFQFASTLGATLDVYEGSSDLVGGTAVTPINNNRNSATTSGLTILVEPTSITDGTKLEGFMAGAGRTAGFYTREDEVILKQNTTYLLRFTSLANLNAWSYVAGWYEHTNLTA